MDWIFRQENSTFLINSRQLLNKSVQYEEIPQKLQESFLIVLANSGYNKSSTMVAHRSVDRLTYLSLAVSLRVRNLLNLLRTDAGIEKGVNQVSRYCLDVVFYLQLFQH